MRRGRRKIRRIVRLLSIIACASGITLAQQYQLVGEGIARILNTGSEYISNPVKLPELKTRNNATPKSIKDSVSAGSVIHVKFLDVGQGDSILINDGGEFMLIDTGSYSNISMLQEELSDSGVANIDTMVLTHPDEDHIGSAATIVYDYGVDRIYMPDLEGDNVAYKVLMQSIADESVEVVHPTGGDLIEFGSASYEVVGPVRSGYEDVNSYSLIVRMQNGQDSFLFTGDATGEEICDVIAAGFDLSANVLKASHHGSANCGCNSEELFQAANPKTVVISCGKDNQYGHPHRETMDLVRSLGLDVYRTDCQGSISCISEGNCISFNQEPAE